MSETGRPSVLAVIAAIIIAGFAVFAFAFVAVIGLAVLAGLFVVGAVASLFSRGRRSGRDLDTVGYGDVIEGEVVEEHAAPRPELAERYQD